MTSAEIIAEARQWYNYDLPEHLIGKSWKGRYRGQTQKWFALRFTGEDSEVNLTPPGHAQEFDQWRWAPMGEVLDLIVPFKRPVYEQVIAEFRHLGACGTHHLHDIPHSVADGFGHSPSHLRPPMI